MKRILLDLTDGQTALGTCVQFVLLATAILAWATL